jgi:hypothetical protein
MFIRLPSRKPHRVPKAKTTIALHSKVRTNDRLCPIWQSPKQVIAMIMNCTDETVEILGLAKSVSMA